MKLSHYPDALGCRTGRYPARSVATLDGGVSTAIVLDGGSTRFPYPCHDQGRNPAAWKRCGLPS